MARGDQLTRQWKIIQTLISARQGKSTAELAATLDCHVRTVYRDLEALQAAGFPLYTERVERNNRWSLLDTARAQFPIPFNLSELMALYFSRDMLQVLHNTVFFESLESLFQKIKATLPPEYLAYLDRIQRSLKVGPKPYKPQGDLKTTIEQISDAAFRHCWIDMVYRSISRGQETRRRVAPYKIWFADGTFYLVGHCRLRNDMRLFALDRIQSLTVSSDTFEPPTDFNVEEFMKASFGVFSGRPATVKIRFDAAVAGYIREKIWHATQKIEPLDNGGLLFEARVAGTDDIKFWVLRWGSQAEVLAPDGLRQEIQAEIEAMQARYR